MNIITVEEWLSLHNDINSINVMHYMLDKTLKYVHHNGAYVIDFNFKEILTDGKNIHYKSVDRLPKNNKDDVIKNNILMLAMQIIKIYNDFPINVPLSFLVEKFDEYKDFLPSDTVIYFDNLIKNNSSDYYSDYCNKKSNDSNQRGNSISLSKSTQVGRLMSNDEAAYASALILPAIIALTFLTALIGYFILK